MSTRSCPSRKSAMILSSSSEKRSNDSSALRLFEIFSPHNASNLSLYAESRFDPTSPSLAAFPATSPAILPDTMRSEEHTSELQSQSNLVCRLLLEKTTQ